MTHYGLYFTNPSNETWEMPVMPGDITNPWEQDAEQFNVVKLGQVNRLGERKLLELTIEGIIPLYPSKSKLSTATKPWINGKSYISKLDGWMKGKKPGRIVVTGDLGINARVVIEKFEWGMADGDSGIFKYTITLREWRDYSAKKIVVKQKKATKTSKAKKTTAKKGKSKPKPVKKIGIGSRVIVNGQLHRDSYGGGPGLTERNADRKITLIAKGRAYPYHVALVNGGARGWVKASAVKLK